LGEEQWDAAGRGLALVAVFEASVLDGDEAGEGREEVVAFGEGEEAMFFRGNASR
jgi:hypothetical protein